ncbi:hypothetical protein K443DRAFT_665872 [Laccaria amethystina LaAM-08-1]|uniref:Uncharacterized protein n=1 Tax=Laccaria amethystina LaAM-08-1 TaxID=1095629 RepID=A0A0C9X5R8_9AGAR|nr:hypothetical protein K443DRAFT_665872 [Laccaria amethystina LaAM-08-1]
MPGRTLTRKLTYSSTYCLIQDSTSVCSLDTPTARTHGKVAARLVSLAKAFNISERLFHPFPRQGKPAPAG